VPHGLEHPVAAGAVLLDFEQDEGLLHQPPERDWHSDPGLEPVVVCSSADGLGGLEGEVAGEHSQPPEQGGLCSGQQLVAPVEGRGHGLLPGGQVADRAGGQCLVEPGEQGGGVQGPRSGRGELQGEG
jgi:hypothetical protein